MSKEPETDLYVFDGPQPGPRIDRDTTNPYICPSCNIPYLHHMGLVTTCRKLQEVKAERDRLRTELTEIVVSQILQYRYKDELEQYQYKEALERIVAEYDFTAPENMLYIAREALRPEKQEGVAA